MFYKITCRCTICGHRWHRRTKNPDSPDPPCPNLDCGAQGQPIGMDLSLNKAPAAVGMSIGVKAIDETVRMVMEDYGMTDMRSDVREGESAAPKLPPQQQALADGYFGGGAGRRRTGGINLAAHARAALSGRLSDPRSTAMSIGATHAARMRPNVEIVNPPRSR